MNLLLFALLGVAIWRGWRGMKRGLTGEISRLLSLVISLFVLSLVILLYTSIKEKNTGNIILSIVIMLVTGLFARLVGLVMKSLRTIARLPGISILDTLLGIGIGVAEAVVALWILYVVISSFDTREFGRWIMVWTQENTWLQKLYDMNQIAYWMAGL